jgi:hypothetical protein
MRGVHRVTWAVAASVAASAIVATAAAIAPAAQAQTQTQAQAKTHAPASFVGGFSTITTVASTVPANGDVNPYGVAVVGHSQGKLIRGDVLVSNFNDQANAQGTGTTIVQIAPNHKVTLFAQINPKRLPGACPGGVGLTTALVILPGGWVVVGSLPTVGGDPATSQAGCLLVLSSAGRVVETFHGHGINGPWDMTAVSLRHTAVLFVTNVLNGTVAAGGNQVAGGTVLRLTVGLPGYGLPKLEDVTTIGSGFLEETNQAALVIGPTGVGFGRNGMLYVADTLGNRIAAIPGALFRHTSAGTGRTVSENGAINGPLGLTIAPNGNILTVNSNDGNLVETTPCGTQVAVKALDTTGTPPGAGTLFGLAVAPRGTGVYFVDDGTNTLNLLS